MAEGISVTGALDDHSSDLLSRAVDMFAKPGMPQLDDSSTNSWSHVCLTPARRGQMCDVAREALRDTLESFQQWSRAGLELAVPKFMEFANRLASFVDVMNCTEWALLVAEVDDAAELAEARTADDAPHELPSGDTCLAQAETFLARTADFNFRRGPLLDLAARIDDSKDILHKIASLSVELGTSMSRLLDDVVPRIIGEAAVRSRMFHEFERMCFFFPRVSSAESGRADG